jgi:uncharacterized membrane protein YeaQ/YmgE (transglycosylase-associated protein family)
MGILYWILLGLVAGAIAKALTPGRDPGGCIVTMVIGIFFFAAYDHVLELFRIPVPAGIR